VSRFFVLRAEMGGAPRLAFHINVFAGDLIQALELAAGMYASLAQIGRQMNPCARARH
jgi:hypothetical protein